ncbi:MAG TPA: prolyl oligopeptidase family serine peptidase [Ramlibacter sp.]
MNTAFSIDDLYLHQRITDLHSAGGVPLAVCAVRSVDREGDKYLSRIWMFSPDGGSGRQLTAGASSDSLPRVAPDGRSVAFVSDRGGDTQLWLLPLDGGEAVCGIDGGDERQVSDLNPWWKQRAPLQLESRTFRVPDAKGGTETIHGWLLRAAGARGPLPLLDDVHGGPAAYAQLDFDTNVFWQVLCSQGWAVLALDPVGSASYGSDFCQRLEGHWGEYDFPQHMQAIRQLRAEGVCDERLAISGKSYGGYMSSWAIGHTDEFRAAIVMAPVGNVETHYGTSDGGYYADPLYTGTHGRTLDRERARELSPLQYVERATTPTLFMQGADDERCPKCQSEELFVSMMRAGATPAELVLYPGEDHHFLGEGAPSVRADAARRIVDWLHRHAGNGRSASGGPGSHHSARRGAARL